MLLHSLFTFMCFFIYSHLEVELIQCTNMLFSKIINKSNTLPLNVWICKQQWSCPLSLLHCRWKIQLFFQPFWSEQEQNPGQTFPPDITNKCNFSSITFWIMGLTRVSLFSLLTTEVWFSSLLPSEDITVMFVIETERSFTSHPVLPLSKH